MAVTTARFVAVEAPYHYCRIVVVCRFSINQPLRHYGFMVLAFHAYCFQFVHIIGVGKNVAHWPKRLSAEVWIKACYNYALALRYPFYNMTDYLFVVEISFFECYYLRKFFLDQF